VHVCAGKPAGEPTADYVKGAAMAAVKTLQGYVDEGNEVKGRNWTQDRGYGHIDQGDGLRGTIKSSSTRRRGCPSTAR